MMAGSGLALQCVELGRGNRGCLTGNKMRQLQFAGRRNMGRSGSGRSSRAIQGSSGRVGSGRSTLPQDMAHIQTLHPQTRIDLPTTAGRGVTPPGAPESINDIDNGNILGFGGDLAPDHPGYGDSAYCDRRIQISKAAKQHVPFAKLNFQEGTVPQLCDIQQALQDATGWNIRPTAGLMHPRDFLNGLAFKTFHSTQYVRHHSNPAYTPEPDVIHEILGHIPMLLCPEYCEIMEHIGQASLGAPDAEIWQLTKVYWYTVEFGVVMEGNQAKAFGAGILSSYGELESMGTGQAEVVPLDLTKPLPKMSYKDGYQKRYFSLESFAAGTDLLKDYADAMIQSRSPGQ